MTDVYVSGAFQRFGHGYTIKDGGGATWTYDPSTNSLSVALTVATGSVADHAITNAKLAQMAQATLKGREAGIGTGDAEDLTPAQAKTLLAIAAGDVSGLAASATTDTTNAANISSGTLPAGRLPALTGDVTTGAGSVATTIAAAAVTLAKMANLAANSVIGNNTGSPATPAALTQAQLTAMVNAFSSTLSGATPASGGGTTKFLRADGTWAAPPGGSATITQATVTLPTPARQSHEVVVTDAAVSGTSKIMLTLGGAAPSAVNEWDDIDLLDMNAVPGTGQFTLHARFLNPISGPLLLNYMVG